MRRPRFLFTLIPGLLFLVAMSWLTIHLLRASHGGSRASSGTASTQIQTPVSVLGTEGDASPTHLYAHNLLLRKGPNFRVYITWVRGLLLRTNPRVVPSFDDSASFVLDIEKGVLRVQLQDLARFMNTGTSHNSPLTNVSFAIKDGKLQMHGVAHKVVPLPVELVGTVGTNGDDLLHLHVEHFSVLKLPLKGLLGDFGLQLDDLLQPRTPGMTIAGNDIVFDTERLLPAPHIEGKLTRVELTTTAGGPALKAIYGDAGDEPAREQRWHNFLQLADGTLNFGKLTMHHVDLIMIDSSKDKWFDLDLENYQSQLVYGVTRMTPQAGMQIFMPDVTKMPPVKLGTQTVTMEWLKDRNLPPPAGIPSK